MDGRKKDMTGAGERGGGGGGRGPEANWIRVGAGERGRKSQILKTRTGNSLRAFTAESPGSIPGWKN